MQRLCVCLCSLCLVATVLAADPAPLVVELFEKKFNTDLAKAQTEVTRAEAELAKARKAAAADRLKSYKERLVEVTKTGDFDKAQSVKLRIEELENESEEYTPKREKLTKRPRPKETVKFGGHTYALIKEPATWHVAKQRCEEMGGHLACFETLKEADFVAKLCGQTTTWVGASDEEEEGRWIWVNGSNAPMPPNNINGDGGVSHCLNWGEGRWNDGTPGERFAYVCEWEK